MTVILISISFSWDYPVGCHNFTLIRRKTMNKNKILQYVTELQELRDRFDSELSPTTLPIEHCLVNFNEGMDQAVEAVMAVYANTVLEEIQNRHLK